MVLIDAGNGKDLQFGHTNYYTGEGRFITRSHNRNERYINPELTVAQRSRISRRDAKRRNAYTVTLLCEDNIVIQTHIHYNHATEALSVIWSIAGQNGKKVRRLN